MNKYDAIYHKGKKNEILKQSEPEKISEAELFVKNSTQYASKVEINDNTIMYMVQFLDSNETPLQDVWLSLIRFGNNFYPKVGLRKIALTKDCFNHPRIQEFLQGKGYIVHTMALSEVPADTKKLFHPSAWDYKPDNHI